MGVVKGTTVTLIADGEDEKIALDGLEQLILNELNDCM
jgi:phosphotransferase system HPr-like phosphotransfer protein